MYKHLVTWALLLASLHGGPAMAQAFEDLDRLDVIVATTVGARIGEPGGALAPVDKRLRLAACPQQPTVEGPVFGAAIVRCDRLGWRIRVPLSGSAAPGQARAQQPRHILVRKGDPVQLVAGNASFTVSRVMVAEEDGAVGDMIRVREDRKSAPVTGRVEPNGIVRVPGV